MDGINLILIGVVLLAAAGAGVWSFLSSPNGPRAAQWLAEVRELEVKIRMNRGPELVEDLRSLAQLYIRLGRRWDAEQALRRAMLISETELGRLNPTVIPVLEDYARLLSQMNRKREATALQKQIEEISDHTK